MHGIENLLKVIAKDLIIGIATKTINEAGFNKTYRGQILEVLGNDMYRVYVNHAEYKLGSNLRLNQSDLVWVMCPCNNINEMYISGKC